MNKKLWICLFVSGLLPLKVFAASCTVDNGAFNLAVSRGDYPSALKLVFDTLKVSSKDRARFHIESGTSDQEATVDTQVFFRGPSAVCETVVHEISHLRQLEQDHRRVENYYREASLLDNGPWVGCDANPASLGQDRAAWVEAAYACLEADRLTSHRAASEIEATLKQVPYSNAGVLEGVDRDYFLEQLQMMSNNLSMLSDTSTDGYYFPNIKHADAHQFCLGVNYVRQQRWDSLPYDAAYQALCTRPLNILHSPSSSH